MQQADFLVKIFNPNTNCQVFEDNIVLKWSYTDSETIFLEEK